MAFKASPHRPFPDDLLRAIGRLAIEWSWLEEEMERLLWRVIGIPWHTDLDFGYAITTHIPFRTRIDIIKAALREYKIDESTINQIDALLSTINEKRGERNDYVHALWTTYPKGTCIATKHSAHGTLKMETVEVAPAAIEALTEEVMRLRKELSEISLPIHLSRP